MRRKDNADGSWTWTIPNPDGAGNYRLRMEDSGRYDSLGKSILRYAFYAPCKRIPLFAGADFGCSPVNTIDSRDSARSLLTFLTLRPGDTDREYFDGYTPEQMAWAESSACEYLSYCAMEESC